MVATKSQLDKVEVYARLVHECALKADGYFVEDNLSDAKYNAKMLIKLIEEIESANKTNK